MTGAEMFEDRIELRHLTTDYSIVGEGPDVLWIAGGGIRGADWHAHFVPLLAGSHRNITFDNRGILTTSCTEPLPWSIQQMAEDTAELLERLCTRPAIVIGHSMGAFIAVQLALDHPDLVARAISLGGAARGDMGWLGDYMRSEVSLRERVGALDPDFAAIHYAALAYPASALGDPVLWREIHEYLTTPGFAENNEAMVVPQWQPCIDWNVADRVSTLRVPLDVVAFEQDLMAPRTYSAELARLVPGARYHELPGLGHMSLYGHGAEQVGALITALLDEDDRQESADAGS